MAVILLILALVCEVLYTLGVHFSGVSMLGLGLCFWIASALTGLSPWPQRTP